MKTVRAEPGSRGFTLIELLIALAMISLITLLLFSGLRLGSRAWEAVETATSQTSGVRLAQGFLVRTLSQTRNASVAVDAQVLPAFNGDAERLEFAAPLSEHVGISGLYVLRLTLEGNGDRRRLILTRWLLHPEILEGGDDFPAWEPLEKDRAISNIDDLASDMDAADGAFGRTLLLGDVSLFDVAYFGIAYGDTEPDWHEDWFADSRPQTPLPALIRIRLATASQSWPDLIIALPEQRL